MTDTTRRRFMGMVGAAGAVVPLSALVGTLPSRAQDDLPLVDPASPQAQALQYVEESPNAEQICGNCTLYQGAPDSEQGPCPLFPGNAVLYGAWCSAYVPKAG